MTFEIVFTLGVALAALVVFAMDRLRLDQVAIAIPVVLLLSGILTPRQALAGLASEATVTVASMLILGLGLSKTGLVGAIGLWARTARLGGDRARKMILCVVVATLSPFLNTTAVVTVFIPVFAALADRADKPVSTYLMPLSFMGILGGTVTLMGTSTNLVVYGEALSRGFDQLNMFSIAPLGLISLAAGAAYMFTIGHWLMPRRPRPPDLSSRYGVRAFVTELMVHPESPAIGRSMGALRWGERFGVSVLDINRDEAEITAPRGEEVIREGDLLSVQGGAEQLLEMAQREGLETPADRTREGPSEIAESARLVETVVAPGSHIVGRSLKSMAFAQRYDATVVALQRHGHPVTERLADEVFRVGDILLLHGTPAALDRISEEPGFVPLSEVAKPVANRPRAAVAAAIMAAVVLTAGLGIVPIVASALGGVMVMLFTRCVHIEEIYSEMNWLVVFVLAGLIPLGIALESTGGAALIADGVTTLTGDFGERGLIAAFYLVTVALTAVVSNAATAVMLTPVALLTAQAAGLNPYALLVTVMFGASASFMTPFGYQTNVMIYGPGGYKFTDFVRVGGPLTVILALTVVLLVPVFYPS